MIRSDIGHDGDCWLEHHKSINLEAAAFDYPPFAILFSYLARPALTYISCQTHIQSCTFHQMISEKRGGGFSIGTRDSYHFSCAESGSKLQLIDHSDSFFQCFRYN